MDPAAFAARPPGQRRKRNAVSVPVKEPPPELPWEASASKKAGTGSASRPDESRQASLDRSMERLRAKLERPRPPAAALSASVEPEPMGPSGLPGAEGGDQDMSVFLVRRKLAAPRRAELMAALAARTGGKTRSSQLVEARLDGDSLTARLDAKTLTLQFSGRAARGRWMASIRSLAGEFDLAEPD